MHYTGPDHADPFIAGRDELLLRWLDELAVDVGRMRRRLEGSLAHLGDRIADTIETLDAIVHPTASELLHRLDYTPLARDVDAALNARDARTRELHRLLGKGQR